MGITDSAQTPSSGVLYIAQAVPMEVDEGLFLNAILTAFALQLHSAQ